MKHFIYEDSKISVEMPIVCGITLIHGNSGTGKSYVCDRVRRAQSDPGIRRGVMVVPLTEVAQTIIKNVGVQ